MHIPEPVMSLAITTKKKESASNFSKALGKFQKEDPTFRVKLDSESNQVNFLESSFLIFLRLLLVEWVNYILIFTLKE
jgi:hypothetical protein